VTSKIQDIAAEGVFTDIAEGIKLARAILELSPRANAQRVIVLLSDGRVEPDPKVSPAFARTLELVHDILPGLRSKETRVFTLAFSDQADRAFLAEMAAATDGLTWFTQTPEEVHRSFAELFGP
jgi:Mg-chelatase subunit ChlD